MAARPRQKADLQVRIRYQNPLPPPPFPPKLLINHTSLGRFADYDVMKPFEAERELPMLVDAELGMYLSPGQDDPLYWEGDRNKVAPALDVETPLDPEDLELLEDPQGATAGGSGVFVPAGSGSNTPMLPAKPKAPGVSWLRRTEYLSTSSTSSPNKENLAAKRKPQEELTPQQRAEAIIASFAAANAPLETLRHPIQKTKKAVKSYPLLPDEEIWANAYKLARYPDNPSKKDPVTKELEDITHGPSKQTETAVIRPVPLKDDFPRYVYYLLKDNQTAQQMLEHQKKLPPVELSNTAEAQDPAYQYFHVRDYEIANRRDLKSELMISIDDGSTAEIDPEKPFQTPRPAGAYYVNLNEHMAFRKRRAKRGESTRDYGPTAMAEGVEPWDEIDIKLGLPGQVIPELVEARKEETAKFRSSVNVALPTIV